jgi:tetratricopeptide (TPR) repeat protein
VLKLLFFLPAENFQVSLELLHKAVSLTEEGDRYRAVTYNNFACVFRRTKKLRSALSYLEKALEIEYNYLHFSEQAVDECLQISNPCDIHLNICAILSQMGKHELALQHAMKALILIQDELISKVAVGGGLEVSSQDLTTQQEASQVSMTGLP